MSDDLFLQINGQKLGGWEDISVTLRAEGFPSSFSVAVSSRDPVTHRQVNANAGDSCQVFLGDDLVVTGYVDRDIDGGDANSHLLQLSGRGRTADLVDCAAEWPSGQLIEGTAFDIASKLCLPYDGLSVELANGAAAGPAVPGWALNYGETGAAIIQRVAQNAGLLAYEDARGVLLLAAAGTRTAASGVVYGQNVEAWSVETAMDQRYSEVVCCNSPVANLDVEGSDFFWTETDLNVARHRRLELILEEVAEPAQEFTIRKAKWEIARRAGRGTTVRVTVDSWRDTAGMLWAPNIMVPVDLPTLKIRDDALCVSEVTFRRDETGTHAELLLLPKLAFLLEPIVLVPAPADITDANGNR